MKTFFLISLHSNSDSDAEDIFRKKYLRVKCGEWLRVGDVIKYKCEIGNLGYKTSEIRAIVFKDENPVKLDDWGFVRYHHAWIQKLKSLVDGVLVDNPCASVWREIAEYHLQEGERQPRKSLEAQRLSGIRK